MPPSAVNPDRLRYTTSQLEAACNTFLDYQAKTSSATEDPPRAQDLSHSEDLFHVGNLDNIDDMPTAELVSANALQHLADLVRAFLKLDLLDINKMDKARVVEQLAEITTFISTTEPGLSLITESESLGKAASFMLLLVKRSLTHGKPVGFASFAAEHFRKLGIKPGAEIKINKEKIKTLEHNLKGKPLSPTFLEMQRRISMFFVSHAIEDRYQGLVENFLLEVVSEFSDAYEDRTRGKTFAIHHQLLIRAANFEGANISGHGFIDLCVSCVPEAGPKSTGKTHLGHVPTSFDDLALQTNTMCTIEIKSPFTGFKEGHIHEGLAQALCVEQRGTTRSSGRRFVLTTGKAYRFAFLDVEKDTYHLSDSVYVTEDEEDIIAAATLMEEWIAHSDDLDSPYELWSTKESDKNDD